MSRRFRDRSLTRTVHLLDNVPRVDLEHHDRFELQSVQMAQIAPDRLRVSTQRLILPSSQLLQRFPRVHQSLNFVLICLIRNVSFPYSSGSHFKAAFPILKIFETFWETGDQLLLDTVITTCDNSTTPSRTQFA